MTLYQDKYRIESARLPWWNYASAGSYFLTICTYQMECIFGTIVNEKMQMSGLGKIVNEELQKSFEIRQELECLSYIIMPNHLHMIVKLLNQGLLKPYIPGVSRIQPKSISSFVGGFKSSATSRINIFRNNLIKDVLHPRFYDHIIRNRDEFDYIVNYIAKNHANWDKDRFNEIKHPDANQDAYAENST